MTRAVAQRGRTLIEVLVAITIGLMLTVGILSIYGANLQTYRASADLQRMQAAGQLALDRLAYQVRMAGYGQLTANFASVSTPTTFTGNPVWVCPSGFNSPVDVSVTPACTGAAGQPDALQVRYQVDEPPVANPVGLAENRDCLGVVVPKDPVTNLRVAQNRFYVAQSNGVPTLMCVGNGNPAAGAPLIPNVEDVRIRLRVGEPFSRAERVVEPEGFADWGRVIGVEICVLVRSEETGVTTGQQAGTDCRDAAFPNDGRLRRTFTQAITLRNRIL